MHIQDSCHVVYSYYVLYCIYSNSIIVMNQCMYVSLQKGMNAVHHAVRNGHLSALKVLLEDCQCQLDLKAEVSIYVCIIWAQAVPKMYGTLNAASCVQKLLM